jgi:hypothetical protein
MGQAIYSATTGGVVSLSAATAKTVIAVTAPSQFGVNWLGYRLGFYGVDAAAEPVTVELCTITFAGAGTTTSITPVQIAGRAITAGFTANKNYTAEPTVVAAFEEFLITPNGGTAIYDWALGESPDNNVSQGFGIRITAPDAVDCRAALRFGRC